MNAYRAVACAALSLSVTFSQVEPAFAQACEWGGTTMICPVHPQAPQSVESLPFGLQSGWFINLFKPRPRKVDETLQRNLAAYASAFHLMAETDRSLDRFARKGAPKSRADLDTRVQDILDASWPGYRSQVAEYGLLNARKRWFDSANRRQKDEIAAIQSFRLKLEGSLRDLRPQVEGVERQVSATRKFEGSLAAIALGQLNDHRAQRNAIATLLVFAPNPGVTAERLDGPAPVVDVPGRLPEPGPPIQFASLAPAYARDLPPDHLVNFVLDPPPYTAPIETKIAAMQSVGRDLQRLRSELPSLRQSVAGLEAENRDDGVREDREAAAVRTIYDENNRLKSRLKDNKERLGVLNQNLNTIGKTIVRELLIDVAIDHATGLIHEKVDEIAGAEGLAATIPKDASDALSKLAREGGKILLPHKGYERQWETFLSAQEQTLGILDRSQGSILDAARLAATASPAEMEAHVEKLFASTGDEAAGFIKLIADREIPEGESPTIKKAFEKYFSLRRKPAGE